MKKRGQLLIQKAILVLLTSAIIIIALLQAGKTYGSQEAFYKLAVAKDLALTIDLMYALPGNLQYTYPNDISGYDIKIKENTIKVYKHDLGISDPTSAIYSFVGLGTDSINIKIKGSQFIRLEKIDNHITIKGVS